MGGMITCCLKMQLMGGRICLESEGLGKGTTCKLYLCIGIYCEPKDIPVTPKRAVSPSTMKNIQVRGSHTKLACPDWLLFTLVVYYHGFKEDFHLLVSAYG
jgi:hypothetical protein